MHRQGLKAIEAQINRPRLTYRTITVDPLTPVIGAEIRCVDLTEEMTDLQFAEIRQALLEHHVIYFRDQVISGEDHKRFARRFGKLHVHPLQAMKKGDNERLVIKASADSKYVAGESWHTDVTCEAEPIMGSLLHIDETPSIGMGGDTLFANMCLAYDMLSEPMKAMLEGLTAIHDGAIPWVKGYGYAPNQAFEKTEHPVVIRHPETGRKVLFVNAGFTSHIVQLNRFESDALLQMLFQHVAGQPSLHCRIRWEPNTLVFWDNRCTQHQAIWDYYPLARSGHRVSVIGGRPTA